jgi:hypothetical protein
MSSSSASQSPLSAFNVGAFFASRRPYIIGWGESVPRSDVYSRRFATELTKALRLLSEQEHPRRRIYGDDADESRLGHTPPETRARYDSAEANAIRSCMRTQEASTPPEERAAWEAKVECNRCRVVTFFIDKQQQQQRRRAARENSMYTGIPIEAIGNGYRIYRYTPEEHRAKQLELDRKMNGIARRVSWEVLIADSDMVPVEDAHDDSSGLHIEGATLGSVLQGPDCASENEENVDKEVWDEKDYVGLCLDHKNDAPQKRLKPLGER